MLTEKIIYKGKDKIGNTAQVGGIETSVLDNGLGRGTRIAWVNTGTGLRYKVIIDRGMDISDAFYKEYSLAWLSKTGVVPPERFSDKGMGWIRNFGGGLLTTCGLSHVGGPEEDEHGVRGLHGLISNTPAEIISIVQPDPIAGKMEMSITGIVREAQVFGPVLELKRTISGKLGQAKIHVHDEVLNRGNQTAPHMLLYHVNFGWPLVDEGTDLLWKGNWESPTPDSERKMFKDEVNFRKCPEPLEAHSGTGEDVAFIDAEADTEGSCHCGIYNKKLNLAVSLRFPKKQLPWLINWQHWGKNEYVTALEPATNPPVGQRKAREDSTLILLEPNESRSYSLELEVLSPEKIESFITSFL
ncbi:aldose 1-epimerase family protein [Zobellia sp. B3R18]|uniref:aldose 1-epimerase family protein n=1 Tax=Zobellia sp. B3R18 TaxID=2841568 RepID=UPI001C0659A7|nr:aldose 1-epimerase family protein [Zobellia sp. B3R18]MBU2976546.1 aldose 1-epimerase family protein [Zobellia sp. B3R18]